MLIDSYLPSVTAHRPFEEDTAVSIIRREGFPPSHTLHSHIPHAYGCPCCSCLSPRKRLPSDGPSAAELDKRRRMQWDVIEERAISTFGTAFTGGAGGRQQSSHRNILRRFYATLQRPLTYQTKAMYNPPAPQTLAALRGFTQSGAGPGDGGGTVLRFDAAGSDVSGTLPTSAATLYGHQLVFTVHYAVGLASLRRRNADAAAFGAGGFQLQVRYGNVGGMTSPAFAGGETAVAGAHGGPSTATFASNDVAVWNQRFSLPLQDLHSPLELFLIDTEAAAQNTDPRNGDYLIGGVMVAPPEVPSSAPSAITTTEDIWKSYRGDHVNLNVTTFEHRGATTAVHSHNTSAASAADNLQDEDAGDDEGQLLLCVSWEVVLSSQMHRGGESSSLLLHDDDHDQGEEADPLAPVPIRRDGPTHPQHQHAPQHVVGSDRGSSIPVSAAAESAVVTEVEITFDIDRIDKYPSASSSSHSKGSVSPILYCMVRRYDGDCSDYVALTRNQHAAAAAAGIGHRIERFSEVEDTGRTCTMLCRIPTSDSDEAARVLQLLVCESEEGVDGAAEEEGAALRVVASTSLLFTALAPRGSATFVLDALNDDDDSNNNNEPFGELAVNWQVTTVSTNDDNDAQAAAAQRLLFSSDEGSVVGASFTSSSLTPQTIDADLLSITVVRGIDLRRAPLGGERQQNGATTKSRLPMGVALTCPLVAVALGPLLASTPIATVPEAQLLLHPRAPCNVTWDQELMFPFPSTNVPRLTLVELIVQQDHEIISVGALSLQNALESSKVLTNVRGGVVEGFEVIPLLQEGHHGALGHILVRWRFIAHDQVALQHRHRGRSRSTETSDNGEAVPAVASTTETTRAEESANATPVKQRLSSSSPSRAAQVLSSLRAGSPPPAATHTPRHHAPGVTPPSGAEVDDSPKILAKSPNAEGGDPLLSPRRLSSGSTSPTLLHLSRRRTSVDGSALTPMKPDIGDGHQAVTGSAGSSPARRGSSAVGLGSPRADPLSLPNSFAADSEAARGGFSVTSIHDDEDQCDVGSAENEIEEMDNDDVPPEPRKQLVFRVRTGDDGRPHVAFFDPTAAPSPPDAEGQGSAAAAATGVPDGAVSTDERNGVVPPVNGPFHFSRDVSQWSSELHANSQHHYAHNANVDDTLVAMDPAQLLREELEVMNRNSAGFKQLQQRAQHAKPFDPQPWYPPGESRDESHVPISRRESQRKQLDAIVELTLKSRYVAHQSAARQRGSHATSAAVSHDVSRSTSVQGGVVGGAGGVGGGIVPGLRPHGMHFAN